TPCSPRFPFPAYVYSKGKSGNRAVNNKKIRCCAYVARRGAILPPSNTSRKLPMKSRVRLFPRSRLRKSRERPGFFRARCFAVVGDQRIRIDRCRRRDRGVGNGDAGILHALALHQREQHRRVRRMQADAAMRGDAAQLGDLGGAVDRIALVEENRMRHRRVVIFARIPRAFEALRLVLSAWGAVPALAGGDQPIIARRAVHQHGHPLRRFADIDDDFGAHRPGHCRQKNARRAGGGERNSTHDSYPPKTASTLPFPTARIARRSMLVKSGSGWFACDQGRGRTLTTMAKALIGFILILSMAAPARAQDKGTLDPKPLPPLAKPDDPATPAKELFGRKSAPAPLASRALGFYAQGCLAGAKALPVNGPTWQVMRLSRNRNWAHPKMVELLEK